MSLGKSKQYQLSIPNPIPHKNFLKAQSLWNGDNTILTIDEWKEAYADLSLTFDPLDPWLKEVLFCIECEREIVTQWDDIYCGLNYYQKANPKSKEPTKTEEWVEAFIKKHNIRYPDRSTMLEIFRAGRQERADEDWKSIKTALTSVLEKLKAVRNT